jgi:hypothetical protein
MNERPDADADLDRRLRRLCSRLDAGPGFATRVLAQAATVHSRTDERVRRELRAQLEAERARATARLLARVRRTLGITVAAAVAACAAAFMYGGAVGGALTALGQGVDWTTINTASLVLLAGWLWLAVRTAARGGAWRLATG